MPLPFLASAATAITATASTATAASAVAPALLFLFLQLLLFFLLLPLLPLDLLHLRIPPLLSLLFIPIPHSRTLLRTTYLHLMRSASASLPLNVGWNCEKDCHLTMKKKAKNCPQMVIRY